MECTIIHGLQRLFGNAPGIRQVAALHAGHRFSHGSMDNRIGSGMTSHQ
jgi:hypothetical protein